MIPDVHPLVASWFLENVGEPTAVQRETWAALTRGPADVLALAPTGSGKTLAAFLVAISRFMDGAYPEEGLSVLYLSPLKALNEDIRRNLLAPLDSLSSYCRSRGARFPRIAAETRSGDTPARDRRHFQAHPPNILAITPESLAILLGTVRGREVLSTVRLLVVDEVHALLGSKRGAFLSCQIARLRELVATAPASQAAPASQLTPSIQAAPLRLSTVALSATLANPSVAARFCSFNSDASGSQSGTDRRAPSQIDADKEADIKAPSSWVLVNPSMEKKHFWQIEFPSVDIPLSGAPGRPGRRKDLPPGESPRHEAIARRIVSLFAPGKTVLVFCDSRRLCERMAHIINTVNGAGSAWAHHGSLSKELRLSVERRLKAGELPCVVATASLELGIDIGEVDQVVLVGTPPSVSQALQRMGRSGHRVNETSRCLILPLHGLDLLQAAALSRLLKAGALESIRPIERPLDILAQCLMALVREAPATADALWERVRHWPPFHKLERRLFDATISLLTGWKGGAEGLAAYEASPLAAPLDTDALEGTPPEVAGASPLNITAGLPAAGALRSLKARLLRDPASGLLHPTDGLAFLLNTSGGAITARGLFALRLPDGTRIGELDEEFVWERRAGDAFSFGNRSWRIQRIDNEAVEVVPNNVASAYMPFWRADERYRSGLLFDAALEILGNPALLEGDDSLSPDAREALSSFLASQTRVQGGIPPANATQLVLEVVKEDEAKSDLRAVFLHSMRGGAINQLLTLSLEAALEEICESSPRCFSSDTGILILIPLESEALQPPAELVQAALRRLYGAQERRRLLFSRVEGSGVFGAAFREAAERSLVLPRPPAGKRLPLWIMRQRARKLFDAVHHFGDFPLTAEAWRVALEDTWDLGGFDRLLDALADGTISMVRVETRSPSPFAQGLVWKETDALLYEGDGTAGRSGASLDDKILADLAPAKLPRPDAALLDGFVRRLKRLEVLRAPGELLELVDWVAERRVIPLEEWALLREFLPPPLQEQLDADPGLGGRLACLPPPSVALPAGSGMIVLADEYERIASDRLAALEQVLRFEGPLSLSRLSTLLGADEEAIALALEELEAAGLVVRGVPLAERGSGFCDRENLERLLRLGRSSRRPRVDERAPAILGLLAASRAGLPVFAPDTGGAAEVAGAAEAADSGRDPFRSLALWQAPAALFEREFLPARNPAYRSDDLDRALASLDLLWRGAANMEVLFCRPDELDLAEERRGGGRIDTGEGFLDFWQLRDALGLDNAAAFSVLWEEVQAGSLSADSFAPIRQGLVEGFSWPSSGPVDPGSGAGGEKAGLYGSRKGVMPRAIAARANAARALARRFRSGPPVPGRWFSLANDWLPDDRDPIDCEELNVERVRLMLSRYGIISRAHLEREIPSLSWSRLLPTLRRMELSGELVTGRFVSGVNSLQFAGPGIVEELERLDGACGIWWVNACDPVSMAGLSAEGLDGRLPPRLAGIRLCFRGSELIALSKKKGKELVFYTDSSSPDAPALAAFAAGPARRAVNSEKPLAVTSINGLPAHKSPWAEPLVSCGGFERDRQRLVIW